MVSEASLDKSQVIKKKLLNDKKEVISAFEKPSTYQSVLTYFKTYAAIFIAIYLGVHLNNPFAIVLVMLFIAGRQHSLYILNHDASHYSLFQNQNLNKYVATVFSNLPMFHHPEAWSFIQWRRVHLMHHSYLFTEKDPNYVGRQLAGDTKKAPTAFQLARSCLLAVPETLKYCFLGKQDYVYPSSITVHKSYLNHILALIVPFRKDIEMERERRLKWLFFCISVLGISYFHCWQPFLLFWIAPMYLFYPMILKYHDLTEHHWDKQSDKLDINTQSVERNYLFQLFLSALPRGFHREHHLFPRIRVKNLPKLKALIGQYEKILGE